jgi:tripartite-type tricarboxylate transporter receptor subunit TctC
VQAPPDGYTILMTVLTNVFNMTLYPNLRFNFLEDITPIGNIADAPFLLMVNPKVPAKTVAEFIAYAKANPGKINFASSGNGSSTHIFTELFKALAGVDLMHVPYRSPYIPDLLSNQVQMVIAPIPQAIQFHRTGELRALGVTTAKPLPDLPGIPPIDATVPGYVAVGWYGLGAPKNTPPEVIAVLEKAVVESLKDPKVREKLATVGVQAMPMTAAENKKFLKEEHAKWSKIIKDAGVQVN